VVAGNSFRLASCCGGNWFRFWIFDFSLIDLWPFVFRRPDAFVLPLLLLLLLFPPLFSTVCLLQLAFVSIKGI